MLGMKLTSSEIDHLMDVCDLDGDGQLDFNEFVSMQCSLQGTREAYVSIRLLSSLTSWVD